MEKPVISVIIPARNEEEYIGQAVESVKSQDFSLPYEIIVVDNASEDKTSEIAKNLSVRVVKEEKLGLTQAREKGYEESRGEILAYLDADSIASRNWLSLIYETFQKNPKIVAVTGTVYFYDWQNKFFSQSWANILERKMIIEIDRAIRKVARKAEVLWGANFAVKKPALEKAGGFNKNIKFYGEDVELSIRLAKVGRVVFKREAIVYTSARRFNENGLSNTILHLRGYFKEIFLPTPIYPQQGSNKNKLLFLFKDKGMPFLKKKDK